MVVAAIEHSLRRPSDLRPEDVAGLTGPLVLVANAAPMCPLVRTLAAMRRRAGAWTVVEVLPSHAVWLDGSAEFRPSQHPWYGGPTEGLPIGSIVWSAADGWGLVVAGADMPCTCRADCRVYEHYRTVRLAIDGVGQVSAPPIPDHLARLGWYAPHLAWLAERGHTPRHAVPLGTVAMRADLRGGDHSGACLRDADLREADCRWAVLRGADLTGAWLDGAVGLPAGGVE